MDQRLSPHFVRSEIACHHCGAMPNVDGLLKALESLRGALGGPLRILDAYRCPVHNAAVGGVSNSQHLYGLAFDPATTLNLAWVQSLRIFSGIGHRGSRVTHLDLRHERPDTNPTRYATPWRPAVFVD